MDAIMLRYTLDSSNVLAFLSHFRGDVSHKKTGINDISKNLFPYFLTLLKIQGLGRDIKIPGMRDRIYCC